MHNADRLVLCFVHLLWRYWIFNCGKMKNLNLYSSWTINPILSSYFPFVLAQEISWDGDCHDYLSCGQEVAMGTCFKTKTLHYAYLSGDRVSLVLALKVLCAAIIAQLPQWQSGFTLKSQEPFRANRRRATGDQRPWKSAHSPAVLCRTSVNASRPNQ